MGSENIGGLVAVTAMADDDLMVLYDVSEAGPVKTKKITYLNFLNSGVGGARVGERRRHPINLMDFRITGTGVELDGTTDPRLENVGGRWRIAFPVGSTASISAPWSPKWPDIDGPSGIEFDTYAALLQDGTEVVVDTGMSNDIEVVGSVLSSSEVATVTWPGLTETVKLVSDAEKTPTTTFSNAYGGVFTWVGPGTSTDELYIYDVYVEIPLRGFV